MSEVRKETFKAEDGNYYEYYQHFSDDGDPIAVTGCGHRPYLHDWNNELVVRDSDDYDPISSGLSWFLDNE